MSFDNPSPSQPGKFAGAGGAYYKLSGSKTFWLPVGGANPTFGVSHTWEDGAVLLRGILKEAGAAGSVIQSALQNLFDGTFISGGVALDSSAIFTESPPHTFSLQSKIFSYNGTGLLTLVNDLLQATAATLSGGVLPSGGSGRFGSAGAVQRPQPFKTIEIVTKSGTIFKTTDMVCTSLNFTFESIFYEEGDPLSVDINMGFKHTKRHFAGSIEVG